MQLEAAHSIATQITDYLQPHTVKIIIAGSIRRQCAVVKDAELVLQPKMVQGSDLFGGITGQVRCNKFIAAVNNIGQRLMGNIATGRFIKFMANDTDLKIDIFIPQPHDYYRILAIRTGSDEYSKKIAAHWKAKGWCGTDDGLRLRSESIETKSGDSTVWKCTLSAPTLPPAWESEEAFFAWLGMPFLNPKFRN